MLNNLFLFIQKILINSSLIKNTDHKPSLSELNHMNIKINRTVHMIKVYRTGPLQSNSCSISANGLVWARTLPSFTVLSQVFTVPANNLKVSSWQCLRCSFPHPKVKLASNQSGLWVLTEKDCMPFSLPQGLFSFLLVS